MAERDTRGATHRLAEVAPRAWTSLVVSVRSTGSADEMEPTRLSSIWVEVGGLSEADLVPAAGGSEKADAVGDALAADCGSGHGLGLGGAAGSGVGLSLQFGAEDCEASSAAE